MEINSLSKLSFDRDRTPRIVTKQNIFIWPPTVSIVEKDVADTTAIGGKPSLSSWDGARDEWGIR